MIVDFHSHAFPDRIAQRAIETLSATGGGLTPKTDGTIDGLRTAEQAADVGHCVLLNIATNPAQQSNVNDFAASANGGFFTAFGSVHPEAPDAPDELDRIAALGLRGVKFHPQYQSFFVDEDRWTPLYEKIAKLGLITVFHSGGDIGLSDPWRCTPQRLRHILPAFCGAPVVAAHLGGYMLWEDAERELVGQDVYLDTACCYGRTPLIQAQRIVSAHGADRILLGSDLPWSSPENEIRYVRHLGLSDQDTALILGGNAARLLGLKG